MHSLLLPILFQDFYGLQALMAGSSFCGFANALRAAAPALTQADFPHLEAFARLAKEFPVKKQEEEDALLSQPRAQPEQPQRRAGLDQPLESQAEQNTVNGSVDNPEDEVATAAASDATAAGKAGVAEMPSEADADAQSESSKTAGIEADAQSQGSAIESPAAPLASQATAKAETKLRMKPDAKTDGKTASKGSRSSSRGPSSDGGGDGKTGKPLPKAPAPVKVSSVAMLKCKEPFDSFCLFRLIWESHISTCERIVCKAIWIEQYPVSSAKCIFPYPSLYSCSCSRTDPHTYMHTQVCILRCMHTHANTNFMPVSIVTYTCNHIRIMHPYPSLYQHSYRAYPPVPVPVPIPTLTPILIPVPEPNPNPYPYPYPYLYPRPYPHPCPRPYPYPYPHLYSKAVSMFTGVSVSKSNY